LIRGLPGSGKSTLAQQLCFSLSYPQDETSIPWFEADQWFSRNGEYKFIGAELGTAHGWCQDHTEQAMLQGCNTVIVSNTFVHRWELAVYHSLAERFGYKVQEIICKGDFGNVHNVPEETLRRMAQNFEF